MEAATEQKDVACPGKWPWERGGGRLWRRGAFFFSLDSPMDCKKRDPNNWGIDSWFIRPLGGNLWFVGHPNLCFQSVFDSIHETNCGPNSKTPLWITVFLLTVIWTLYDNIFRVRCNTQGHLTHTVPDRRGVKEEWILAPLLFNLCVNSLILFWCNSDCHPPKLAIRPILAVLYAVNIVILSFSEVGLRTVLPAFKGYCAKEHLEIN